MLTCFGVYPREPLPWSTTGGRGSAAHLTHSRGMLAHLLFCRGPGASYLSNCTMLMLASGRNACTPSPCAESKGRDTVENSTNFRTKTLVILEKFQFFEKNFYLFIHKHLAKFIHPKIPEFSNQSCRYV